MLGLPGARMNFDLTEDQREIRRTAREFLAARYTPEKIRAIALDGAADPHWDEVAELGWPDIAEEYGIVELAVVAEELGLRARADAAVGPRRAASCWSRRGRRRRGRPRPDGSRAVAMWDREGRPIRGADAEGRRRATDRRQDRRARTPTSPTCSWSPPRAVATSASDAADATIEPARALDATKPLFTVRVDGATPGEGRSGDFGRAWHAIAVTAAAESVGVARAR